MEDSFYDYIRDKYYKPSVSQNKSEESDDGNSFYEYLKAKYSGPNNDLNKPAMVQKIFVSKGRLFF